MQFAATITRADVAHATAYVVFRNRAFWLIPAFFCVLTLWGQWHGDQRPADWFQAVYVLHLHALIWGAFYLVLIAYLVLVTVFHTATRKGVLGGHTYEIRPDGFFETTVFNETLTRWPAFPRVVRTFRAIFLRQSWWLFHIIPRRAFADDASYDTFYRELQARIHPGEDAGAREARETAAARLGLRRKRLILGTLALYGAAAAGFASYAVFYFLRDARLPHTPEDLHTAQWGYQSWSFILGYGVLVFGLSLFFLIRSFRKSARSDGAVL